MAVTKIMVSLLAGNRAAVHICVTRHICLFQCPDSTCKQDLLAYLQRIALYCHQLNICSKVKAEVQNLGGELVVSGVGSVLCCCLGAEGHDTPSS